MHAGCTKERSSHWSWSRRFESGTSFGRQKCACQHCRAKCRQDTSSFNDGHSRCMAAPHPLGSRRTFRGARGTGETRPRTQSRPRPDEKPACTEHACKPNFVCRKWGEPTRSYCPASSLCKFIRSHGSPGVSCKIFRGFCPTNFPTCFRYSCGIVTACRIRTSPSRPTCRTCRSVHWYRESGARRILLRQSQE